MLTGLPDISRRGWLSYQRLLDRARWPRADTAPDIATTRRRKNNCPRTSGQSSPRVILLNTEVYLLSDGFDEDNQALARLIEGPDPPDIWVRRTLGRIWLSKSPPDPQKVGWVRLLESHWRGDGPGRGWRTPNLHTAGWVYSPDSIRKIVFFLNSKCSLGRTPDTDKNSTVVTPPPCPKRFVSTGPLPPSLPPLCFEGDGVLDLLDLRLRATLAWRCYWPQLEPKWLNLWGPPNPGPTSDEPVPLLLNRWCQAGGSTRLPNTVEATFSAQALPALLGDPRVLGTAILDPSLPFSDSRNMPLLKLPLYEDVDLLDIARLRLPIAHWREINMRTLLLGKVNTLSRGLLCTEPETIPSRGVFNVKFHSPPGKVMGLALGGTKKTSRASISGASARSPPPEPEGPKTKRRKTSHEAGPTAVPVTPASTKPSHPPSPDTAIKEEEKSGLAPLLTQMWGRLPSPRNTRVSDWATGCDKAQWTYCKPHWIRNSVWCSDSHPRVTVGEKPLKWSIHGASGQSSNDYQAIGVSGDGHCGPRALAFAMHLASSAAPDLLREVPRELRAGEPGSWVAFRLKLWALLAVAATLSEDQVEALEWPFPGMGKILALKNLFSHPHWVNFADTGFGPGGLVGAEARLALLCQERKTIHWDMADFFVCSVAVGTDFHFWQLDKRGLPKVLEACSTKSLLLDTVNQIPAHADANQRAQHVLLVAGFEDLPEEYKIRIAPLNAKEGTVSPSAPTTRPSKPNHWAPLVSVRIAKVLERVEPSVDQDYTSDTTIPVRLLAPATIEALLRKSDLPQQGLGHKRRPGSTRSSSPSRVENDTVPVTSCKKPRASSRPPATTQLQPHSGSVSKITPHKGTTEPGNVATATLKNETPQETTMIPSVGLITAVDVKSGLQWIMHLALVIGIDPLRLQLLAHPPAKMNSSFRGLLLPVSLSADGKTSKCCIQSHSSLQFQRGATPWTVMPDQQEDAKLASAFVSSLSSDSDVYRLWANQQKNYTGAIPELAPAPKGSASALHLGSSTSPGTPLTPNVDLAESILCLLNESTRAHPPTLEAPASAAPTPPQPTKEWILGGIYVITCRSEQDAWVALVKVVCISPVQLAVFGVKNGKVLPVARSMKSYSAIPQPGEPFVFPTNTDWNNPTFKKGFTQFLLDPARVPIQSTNGPTDHVSAAQLSLLRQSNDVKEFFNWSSASRGRKGKSGDEAALPMPSLQSSLSGTHSTPVKSTSHGSARPTGGKPAFVHTSRASSTLKTSLPKELNSSHAAPIFATTTAKTTKAVPHVAPTPGRPISSHPTAPSLDLSPTPGGAPRPPVTAGPSKQAARSQPEVASQGHAPAVQQLTTTQIGELQESLLRRTQELKSSNREAALLKDQVASILGDKKYVVNQLVKRTDALTNLETKLSELTLINEKLNHQLAALRGSFATLGTYLETEKGRTRSLQDKLKVAREDLARAQANFASASLSTREKELIAAKLQDTRDNLTNLEAQHQADLLAIDTRNSTEIKRLSLNIAKLNHALRLKDDELEASRLENKRLLPLSSRPGPDSDHSHDVARLETEVLKLRELFSTAQTQHSQELLRLQSDRVAETGALNAQIERLKLSTQAQAQARGQETSAENRAFRQAQAEISSLQARLRNAESARETGRQSLDAERRRVAELTSTLSNWEKVDEKAGAKNSPDRLLNFLPSASHRDSAEPAIVSPRCPEDLAREALDLRFREAPTEDPMESPGTSFRSCTLMFDWEDVDNRGGPQAFLDLLKTVLGSTRFGSMKKPSRCLGKKVYTITLSNLQEATEVYRTFLAGFIRAYAKGGSRWSLPPAENLPRPSLWPQDASRKGFDPGELQGLIVWTIPLPAAEALMEVVKRMCARLNCDNKALPLFVDTNIVIRPTHGAGPVSTTIYVMAHQLSTALALTETALGDNQVKSMVRANIHECHCCKASNTDHSTYSCPLPKLRLRFTCSLDFAMRETLRRSIMDSLTLGESDAPLIWAGRDPYHESDHPRFGYIAFKSSAARDRAYTLLSGTGWWKNAKTSLTLLVKCERGLLMSECPRCGTCPQEHRVPFCPGPHERGHDCRSKPRPKQATLVTLLEDLPPQITPSIRSAQRSRTIANTVPPPSQRSGGTY